MDCVRFATLSIYSAIVRVHAKVARFERVHVSLSLSLCKVSAFTCQIPTLHNHKIRQFLPLFLSLGDSQSRRSNRRKDYFSHSRNFELSCKRAELFIKIYLYKNRKGPRGRCTNGTNGFFDSVSQRPCHGVQILLRSIRSAAIARPRSLADALRAN